MAQSNAQPPGIVSGLPMARWSADWGPSSRDRARRLLSEAIGVFGLVFVLSTGAATLTQFADMPGWAVGTLLAFSAALWLAAAIYFLGDVSAHYNPAVTFAFAIRREITWPLAGAYVVVQCLAAIAAAFAARAFFGDSSGLARTDPQPGLAIEAVVFEAILTLGLTLMVLGMAAGPKLNHRFIPLAVAAYVAAACSIGGPFEGASMNPARSLGPALATMDLSDIWVYIVGPCLGAAIAVVVAEVLRDPPGTIPPGTQDRDGGGI